MCVRACEAVSLEVRRTVIVSSDPTIIRSNPGRRLRTSAQNSPKSLSAGQVPTTTAASLGWYLLGPNPPPGFVVGTRGECGKDEAKESLWKGERSDAVDGEFSGDGCCEKGRCDCRCAIAAALACDSCSCSSSCWCCCCCCCWWYWTCCRGSFGCMAAPLLLPPCCCCCGCWCSCRWP
ncbi:hypothetical protein DFJ73DRAFT_871654 [Zopfochytrium polystomum]|nr:hypothetical protein DFJ73DRAFT_871654 [Zopfochytrium polystomum]